MAEQREVWMVEYSYGRISFGELVWLLKVNQ